MQSFTSIRPTKRRFRSLWLERLEARVVPSLVAAQAFDVGDGPRSVAVGEFNNDGRPDLAVANYLGNSVSVLLGNGDGSFSAAQDFPVGARPASVAVGDFNGDGRSDLTVANFNNANVSVLLGNGDGSFQGARNFAAGTNPSSAAVGDVNGDGRLDLVVANDFVSPPPLSTSTVSVLLGNGDGTLQNPRSFFVTSRPQSVAVGDVNGDGRLDLATANGNNTVAVLLGNGDGNFQNARNFTLPIGSPRSAAMGDVNGDGRLDLAVAKYGTSPNPGTVDVLLGNGDGSFQGVQSFPAGGTPRSLVMSDFNSDGRLDVALANYANSPSNNNVSVLLGNGDGSFQSASQFPGGRRPYAVAVGDVNSDGRFDLAAANYGSNSASVLLGNDDGSFLTAPSFAAGFWPFSVAVGDVNGDSRPDLAVTDRDLGFVDVLLGNGDGSFQAARNFPVGTSPESVAVGDFNGDNRLDLVVTNTNSANVSVLIGNGDGSFQPARNVGVGGFPRAVSVGDFNGDGRLDLAVANTIQNGTASVLLGNGDGSFQAPRTFAAGSYPGSVVVGDINGDSRLDLALANFQSANVSVLLGNGNGTFQAARNFAVGSNPGSVAVGDVNGDGRLDLAAANYGSNNVSVLLGNGDGSFQNPRNFSAGPNPGSVAMGDLNGDGRLDLAIANYYQNNNTVRVLLGNGDGSFQTSTSSYLAGIRPRFVTMRDLNSDGFLDLAVANSDANGVSILLNDGYWGGPAVYFYIYPDSGTVTAGQPFDVYVVALNASFEIVTSYTGQILFYATDPQASTPVYYQFQLSDHGIAYFPGGLTFNTLGLQELYVFDWPAIQVFGYAAYNVAGAGPGGAPQQPALDLSAIEAVSQPVAAPVRPFDAAPPSPPWEPHLQGPDDLLAALPSAEVPLEALAPPLVDRLFGAVYDRGTWEQLADGRAAASA